MSKSLGNIASLQEVLDRWGRETVLLYFMTAAWRSPVDFSDEVMEQTAAQVETFRNAFVEGGDGSADWEELVATLEDDFNTPEALAVLHRWRAAGALGELRRGLELFGLGSLAERAEAPTEVVELAAQRQAARDSRDFEASDRLRDEIAAQGWEVRDRAGGYELVPK
jgi:cysteinyl-tRNA synthetase